MERKKARAIALDLVHEQIMNAGYSLEKVDYSTGECLNIDYDDFRKFVDIQKVEPVGVREEYTGMNFQEWCNLDKDDERKINYTLKGIIEGKEQVIHFTSEDTVDGMMMYRVQNSAIKQLSLDPVKNEWDVTLVY